RRMQPREKAGSGPSATSAYRRSANGHGVAPAHLPPLAADAPRRSSYAMPFSRQHYPAFPGPTEANAGVLFDIAKRAVREIRGGDERAVGKARVRLRHAADTEHVAQAGVQDIVGARIALEHTQHLGPDHELHSLAEAHAVPSSHRRLHRSGE